MNCPEKSEKNLILHSDQGVKQPIIDPPSPPLLRGGKQGANSLLKGGKQGANSLLKGGKQEANSLSELGVTHPILDPPQPPLIKGGRRVGAIAEKQESNVRSYCRNFPEVFQRAKGSMIYAESGQEYIDFLAGAGALNYGHNNDFIKQKVMAYLEMDGVAHGLDLYTSAKENFLLTFDQLVLKPKNLNYKLQFCGPTGTNAVEAALKLARKIKKRSGIFSFMGAYHGMTLGSLSITGNTSIKAGTFGTVNPVTFMPYPFGFMETFDTIDYIDAVLNDVNSGIEKPAAIIFETVQAEGGIIVAPISWMQRLRELCDRHDILLICDDIQVGCGRTGSFFSFERADIVPDIVVLSKSISGYGFPMSLLLIKPELDIWEPGEHTGTFRGNQLAFVAGEAALEYREITHLEQDVKLKEYFLKNFLHEEIAPLDSNIKIRGIGMIWGIDVTQCGGSRFAKEIASRCFELGLIVERVGRDDTVIKILPPLTIEISTLQTGCSIIKQAFVETRHGASLQIPKI